MAVVNTKAAALSALDTTPVDLNYSYHFNGEVRNSYGTAEKAGSDSNASVYRMCRVPSNARIISIAQDSDAVTGMTDVDFGVYDIDTGAVVTKDLLIDGADLSSAVSTITTPSAVAAENKGKRLYDLLGLTEDPNKDYDLCWTANTAGAGAGTLAISVNWVL